VCLRRDRERARERKKQHLMVKGSAIETNSCRKGKKRRVRDKNEKERNKKEREKKKVKEDERETRQ